MVLIKNAFVAMCFEKNRINIKNKAMLLLSLNPAV